MKANHIPRAERLKRRIRFLQYKADAVFVPSPSKGNPYHCCSSCEIHTPSFSINGNRHFKGCKFQGLDKQIAYYKQLLAEEVSS